MKVLIIDSIHSSLDRILSECGHECLDMSQSPNDEVQMALPFAEILVMRSRIDMDQMQIDRCPNLKIIARAGAGLEHIDLAYAQKKGIVVLSSPEGNRVAVAEHALGMILSLFNNLSRADAQVRDANWFRKPNEGIELSGKTVGIIGYGNTGSAFAKVLAGFDVRILAYDKYLPNHDHAATMEEIYAHADIVSLHLPLTDETDMLASKAWYDKFSKPIYLINTSRGPIVNTNDLLQAISSGQILGACLDVLEFESGAMQLPAKAELPASALGLFQSEKVLLSPHIAGLTQESYEKLSKILAEKILAELK